MSEVGEGIRAPKKLINVRCRGRKIVIESGQHFLHKRFAGCVPSVTQILAVMCVTRFSSHRRPWSYLGIILHFLGY